MATQLSDEELLALLQRDSNAAIDLLFRKYYPYICRQIYRILPDATTVEDIAQEVFYELWKKRDRININSSLQAYLKRAAVNKTLNHIRDTKINFEEEDRAPVQHSRGLSAVQQLEQEELNNMINSSIENLPERCRIIFSLSRFEDMTYQEIADKLEISIKTVENQISRALRQLREALEPYINRNLLLLGVIFSHFF